MTEQCRDGSKGNVFGFGDGPGVGFERGRGSTPPGRPGRGRRLLVMALFLLLCLHLALPVSAASTASKKIKLSNTKLTVLIGGMERQLTVLNTKKSVTWSSSKPSVATVTKKGVIKPRKVGETVIKAKVGKKTLKCKVTVLGTWDDNIVSLDSMINSGFGQYANYAKKNVKWRKKWVKKYLTSDMSDQEIVLTAARWICNNATYTYDLSSMPLNERSKILFNSLSIFQFHTGVCENYAWALQFLLAPTGVYNTLVKNINISHAWNEVQIDGKWYNVDVTNMDGGGSVNYQNDCTYAPFLVSDKRYLEIYWSESGLTTKTLKEGYYHGCSSTRYDFDLNYSTNVSSPWIDGTWVDH